MTYVDHVFVHHLDGHRIVLMFQVVNLHHEINCQYAKVWQEIHLVVQHRNRTKDFSFENKKESIEIAKQIFDICATYLHTVDAVTINDKDLSADK